MPETACFVRSEPEGGLSGEMQEDGGGKGCRPQGNVGPELGARIVELIRSNPYIYSCRCDGVARCSGTSKRLPGAV